MQYHCENFIIHFHSWVLDFGFTKSILEKFFFPVRQIGIISLRIYSYSRLLDIFSLVSLIILQYLLALKISMKMSEVSLYCLLLCNLILFYHLDDSRILLFPLMLDNRLCLDILFYVNLMDPFNLQTQILLFFSSFNMFLNIFLFHSLAFTLQRYPFSFFLSSFC